MLDVVPLRWVEQQSTIRRTIKRAALIYVIRDVPTRRLLKNLMENLLERDDAPLNMSSFMDMTFEVSQDEMSWLNDDASPNISSIIVAFDVSQDDMSCLNDDAPRNTAPIFVTFEVSQDEISRLLVSKIASQLII
eukprot:scaffold303632_cov47-Attheya_sp.AAC.2